MDGRGMVVGCVGVGDELVVEVELTGSRTGSWQLDRYRASVQAGLESGMSQSGQPQGRLSAGLGRSVA